jgi:DNA-binding response OmpR family regulator
MIATEFEVIDMGTARVLLVDNDELIRYNLTRLLDDHGFEVTTAASVLDALRNITSEQYDVLLSDLHSPGPGDCLTVVRAMRHANPRAVTLLLDGSPGIEEPVDTILLQADEIVVKPVDAPSLIDVIKQRLVQAPSTSRQLESVSDILERDLDQTIERWARNVRQNESLMNVAITPEDRALYLPRILRDLISRLRAHLPIGAARATSPSSVQHGADRYRQGYSTAMVVEESRYLQVSIFETLQINLLSLDFSVVLSDVMVIADEIDHQLSQMMRGYDDAAAA